MFASLIIYSKTDGYTKTICERISNFLNDLDLVKLISINVSKKLYLVSSKEHFEVFEENG